jgi:hypothetical protein
MLSFRASASYLPVILSEAPILWLLSEQAQRVEGPAFALVVLKGHDFTPRAKLKSDPTVSGHDFSRAAKC